MQQGAPRGEAADEKRGRERSGSSGLTERWQAARMVCDRRHDNGLSSLPCACVSTPTLQRASVIDMQAGGMRSSAIEARCVREGRRGRAAAHTSCML